MIDWIRWKCLPRRRMWKKKVAHQTLDQSLGQLHLHPIERYVYLVYVKEHNFYLGLSVWTSSTKRASNSEDTTIWIMKILTSLNDYSWRYIGRLVDWPQTYLARYSRHSFLSLRHYNLHHIQPHIYSLRYFKKSRNLSSKTKSK